MRRDELRDQMGMVLQDTWLFGGTIRDNIAYGNIHATEEQILAAAKACYVDRFVHSLPDGYDTVLDDEGTSVSAGEKQLLTIARAFLSDPAILILDEATSSVDTRTEVLIQRAMAKLRGGRTSFVIAHRLSTIRDADTILVMDGGRIVEQGSHHDLLRPPGRLLRALQRPVRGRRHRRRLSRLRAWPTPCTTPPGSSSGPHRLAARRRRRGHRVRRRHRQRVLGLQPIPRRLRRATARRSQFGPLAGTMMACPDEAMAVEHEVLRRLGAHRRARSVDGRLAARCSAPTTNCCCSSGRSAPTSWWATGWSTASTTPTGRPSSPPAATSPSPSRPTPSRQRGLQPVPRPFVVTDDGLRHRPADGHPQVLRRRRSRQRPTIMEQEAALLAALEHATGYRLEGSRLTLTRPDGGISVSLHRA